MRTKFLPAITKIDFNSPLPMERSRQRPTVTYSNWFARLFLKSVYTDQWVIPQPLPAPAAAFLRWYERRRMPIDLGGIAIDRPIFIISLPRCGSSMLQDLLCTHPGLAYTTNMMDICRDAFCAAEHFRRKLRLNIRGERFLRDSVVVDGASPADPVATWADFFGEDYFEISDDRPQVGRIPPERIAHIRTSLKKVLWCFGGGERRFFCKTPMLLPYLGVLNALFPDAKFIHLLRDPRQGANSMVKLHRICNERLEAIRRRRKRPLPDKPFVPYPRLPRLKEYLGRFGPDDVRTTARLWNDAIDHVDALRGDIAHLHEVRYEDILAEPQKRLDALFEFCELPPPGPENDAYARKLAGVGVVHHKNDYGDFAAIERICAAHMRRHGYLPEPPSHEE